MSIACYSFAPKIGPLRVTGLEADYLHLRALQDELVDEGWLASINSKTEGVCTLSIYHPHDPASFDFRQ